MKPTQYRKNTKIIVRTLRTYCTHAATKVGSVLFNVLIINVLDVVMCSSIVSNRIQVHSINITPFTVQVHKV